MKTFINSIVIASLTFFYSCEGDNTQQLNLNPRITTQAGMMTIENKDTVNYENLEITINDAYTLSDPGIKKGEAKVLSLQEFADGEGNRFTLEKKQKSVQITCETGHGNTGFYYGEME